MCGIAGLWTKGRPDPALLAAMGRAIAHRGPDDEGVWIDPEAGLGLAHRRLAIVDLSPHGHQPMLSSDGRFVLSYNGEIYNHAELRNALDVEGHTPEGGWRGHSDTETLIEAIAAWGLDAALDRAVGMFAFALWDRRERRLQLVRDRFGEKPLYYGWAGRDFVFASELKAIRRHPSFEPEIDRRALHAYAARTNVPAPLSIYRRLFKLQPGCILTLTADTLEPFDAPPGEGAMLRRYWSYRRVVEDGLADPITDEAEAKAALEQALNAAIDGQAVADVPVGAFLSGGIDSSAVTAFYQERSAIPVRTYSIGFEEAGYNEAADARAVAAHLGTVHQEYVVTAAEARDVIPLLPQIYDEPFADSSQIPTFIVSRFARSEVTVALTGDGGDELFAGYNRHVSALALWRALRRMSRPVRSVLGRLPPGLWVAAARGLPGRAQPHLGGKLHKALRSAGAARDFGDVYDALLDEWAGERSPVLGGSGLPRAATGVADDTVATMLSDAIGYLPDDILAKVDRASMAVSLETRVPFLDHRLAAVAARIPLAMKVRAGRGKHILRQLLYARAPKALFDRPKAGFAVPVGQWIKGPLREWAESLLDPARLETEGWFDPAIVRRRWDEHRTGRRDSAPAIWAILMFQAWLDEQNA